MWRALARGWVRWREGPQVERRPVRLQRREVGARAEGEQGCYAPHGFETCGPHDQIHVIDPKSTCEGRQMGRRIGGQVHRWADGQVGRWAGGKGYRWTRAQVGWRSAGAAPIWGSSEIFQARGAQRAAMGGVEIQMVPATGPGPATPWPGGPLSWLSCTLASPAG